MTTHQCFTGITSPDVSISGSQLFIGFVSDVLFSVIDQVLLAIEIKTFREIIVEITSCYLIIKKQEKKRIFVEERRRRKKNSSKEREIF